MADKAVLCGINDYESISDLRGCVNDALNLQRLLEQTFGFESANIRTYADNEVTRDTIEDAFDWLAGNAKPEDRLVFHFSGHGSYTKSKKKDEPVDELICLYEMDWDDPESYMLDDDLGALTRKVKVGQLTVILDCCHSGTGTRALTRSLRDAQTVTPKTQFMITRDTACQMGGEASEDLERGLRRGTTSAMRSLREASSEPVFARFVQPPATIHSAIEKKRSQLTFRRLRAHMKEDQLNHQLLAGADDDQTAADALIGGKFNGAFTYYLCESARHRPRSTYGQVMDATISIIARQGYSQRPQNEGPFSDRILFGSSSAPGTSDEDGRDNAPDSDGPETSPPSISGPSAGALIDQDSQPLDLLGDLLRVSEKLIDMARTPARRPGRPSTAVRSEADECVVYVHGISKHEPGYSRSWWRAMEPHLVRRMTRKEVRWSQIVNRRSLERADQDIESEIETLARSIETELAKRSEALETQCTPVAARSGTDVPRIEQPRGAGLQLDDFARYMLVKATRKAILAEFDKIVRPLLAAGKKVHIVSHSWGTVVAYEGLRRLDRNRFSGRVANLFVAGSALSIGMVRSNLFGRVSDGRLPARVDRLINLDAAGDVVGGGIGDHFLVHREFLRLDPVGCREIPFTNIAINPACAHGSYFRSANTEVNANIFAKFINAS